MTKTKMTKSQIALATKELDEMLRGFWKKGGPQLCSFPNGGGRGNPFKKQPSVLEAELLRLARTFGKVENSRYARRET
jgi:hypothetical protein